MELKRCSTCDNLMELSYFSDNPGKKDGLNSICKHCHSIYRKEYYKKNKAKEIENAKRSKSRYRLDPEFYYDAVYCSSCGKAIYRPPNLNKGKLVYFCSNVCQDISKYKGKLNKILKESEKRSKIKRMEFNLDYDFLYDLFYNTQKEKCAITNIPILLPVKGFTRQIHKQASLDRIDSSKGYTKDNVRFVVLGVNYMKHNQSDESLIELLKAIKEHFK